MTNLSKKVPHPGSILHEKFLAPKGITQMGFAAHLGWSSAKINKLVRGKRGITPLIALHFADAFGTEPEYWMDLQSRYDLAEASMGYKKVARMKG
jgi:addiction module HigA family antidote